MHFNPDATNNINFNSYANGTFNINVDKNLLCTYNISLEITP